MIQEIDLYGVFLPSLLIWMLIAVLITISVRRTLAATGFYAYVWHRPLFDIALYVVSIGIVVAVVRMLS